MVDPGSFRVETIGTSTVITILLVASSLITCSLPTTMILGMLCITKLSMPKRCTVGKRKCPGVLAAMGKVLDLALRYVQNEVENIVERC